MKSVWAVAVAAVLGLGSVGLAQDAPERWTRIEERDPGETWFVFVEKIPTSVEEFRAMRDELCTTPQGAIVTFLVAGIIFGKDQTLGEQCMVVSLDGSLLDETYKAIKKAQRPDKAVDGFQLGGRVLAMMNSSGFQDDIPYAGNAYVEGTSTAERYVLPEKGPYKFVIRKHRTPPKAGEWKGFANCSGASGPKPYDVKEVEAGKWRMLNASSFFAGTEQPPAAPPRAPR